MDTSLWIGFIALAFGLGMGTMWIIDFAILRGMRRGYHKAVRMAEQETAIYKGIADAACEKLSNESPWMRPAAHMAGLAKIMEAQNRRYVSTTTPRRERQEGE